MSWIQHLSVRCTDTGDVYKRQASLATRYGLDEGKHGMTDYGSECTFDLSWQIADNIKWLSLIHISLAFLGLFLFS